MDRVSSTNVREWSQLDFAERGFGEASPDPLDQLVSWSNDYVAVKTGRPIDVTMPTEYAGLAQQAVKLRAEQLVVQASSDYVGDAGEDLMASMNTTGYGESRRGLEEFTKVLNPWPALHGLLWDLMTAEKRAEWLVMIGQSPNEPAWETTEVDWAAWDDVSWGGLWGP